MNGKILSLLWRIPFSIAFGLVNGTLIAYLMIHLSDPLLGRHEFPFDGSDPSLLGLAVIFGGGFAAIVYPIFFWTTLREVPFRRMYLLTFPVVLVTTTAGWILGTLLDTRSTIMTSDFAGGYLGGFLGLAATALYFKLLERTASGSAPSSAPGRSDAKKPS